MRPGLGIRDWGLVKGNGEAHASADPDCVRDHPAIGILTNGGRCRAVPLPIPNLNSPIPAPMR